MLSRKLTRQLADPAAAAMSSPVVVVPAEPAEGRDEGSTAAAAVGGAGSPSRGDFVAACPIEERKRGGLKLGRWCACGVS